MNKHHDPTEFPPAEAESHPDDCLYCAAGESSVHNYEPPPADAVSRLERGA